MLKEQCAVVGIVSKDRSKHLSKLIYNSLLALQHRGQESAGIASYDGSSIKLHKNSGLVASVFDNQSLQKLFGNVAMGHVRYSTTGDPRLENIQPFVVECPGRVIAIGHNGNLVNYKELKDTLESKGHVFVSDTDSEVIAHILASELMNSRDIDSALVHVMSKLEGAYSIVMLTSKGELIAVRDPFGFRPLCLGTINDDMTIIASESVAIDVNGGTLQREVAPGEVLIIDEKGMRSDNNFSDNKKAHCMFEYVYFSRVDSILDTKSAYRVRYELGRQLALHDTVDADIVVPVPDSAKPAAAGYSEVSGLKNVEGLIKNRYVGRTFIMPYQKERDSSIRLKLNAIIPEIRDMRIVLIDDSIVRGTTSKRIVDLLKSSGAKEVHFRVTCPPIIGQCFYGIDIRSCEDLIAHQKTVEQIRDSIHADTLMYQTIEGLVTAIGCKKEDLCLGCLTLQYPTNKAQELSDLKKCWYGKS